MNLAANAERYFNYARAFYWLLSSWPPNTTTYRWFRVPCYGNQQGNAVGKIHTPVRLPVKYHRFCCYGNIFELDSQFLLFCMLTCVYVIVLFCFPTSLSFRGIGGIATGVHHIFVHSPDFCVAMRIFCCRLLISNQLLECVSSNL